MYLLEDEGELADRVVSLRERMIERNDELLTSALTLGEVLVKPLEAGDETLARHYEQAVMAAATVIAMPQVSGDGEQAPQLVIEELGNVDACLASST